MNAQQLNRLGVEAAQRGDLDLAVARYRQALDVDRSCAEAWFNQALAQVKLGQLAAAERSLTSTLAIRNDIAIVHESLGKLRLRLDRPEDAIPHLQQSVVLAGDRIESWLQLALAQTKVGDTDSAIQSYQMALSIDGRTVEALVNLAGIYRDRGQLDSAGRLLETAIDADPTSFEAHHNLGTIHFLQNDVELARSSWLAATQLNRQNIGPLIRLGQLASLKHDIQQATQLFHKAAEISPHSAAPWRHLGNIEKYRGDAETAALYYSQAAGASDAADLDRLRSASLCPTVFASSAAAADQVKYAMNRWSEAASALSNPDWGELIHSSCEPAIQFQFHSGNPREWMETFARPFACRAPQFESRRNNGQPRIVFLVTSGHERAFLNSIGAAVDHLATTNKEVVVVAPSSCHGMLRSSLSSAVGVATLPFPFQQIQQSLRELAPDVLYFWEIGTDSVNYFLPMVRWAPVQCTSIGLQITSGIPTVDYYLSSHWLEHEDSHDFYSESLLLGKSLLFSRPLPTDLPPAATADDIRIGCLHQLGKLHPDWDATLQEILRRLPTSRLLVLEDLNGAAVGHLQRRWQRTMPEAMDRIEFLPRMSLSEYRQTIARLRFMLDPPYFTGTNTTLDALAQGCPVVTLPGDDQRARFTYACYSRMDLQELIAADIADYIELAVRLAQDNSYRESAHRRILASQDRLYDHRATFADYEDFVDQLMERARS